MKISIIIPAFNEEENIEATICAVLAQTYPDFEVIIVDNGSTDGTAKIVKSFGDKIRLLYEEKKGTQWAREKGRLEAKGEIIANIDADCLPTPDWLSKGIKFFKSENVVALGGPYDYYDASKFVRFTSLIFQKSLYVFSNWFFQKIGKGAVLIGGNILLKAEALNKAGGYNTDLIFYGDDTDTAKRMSKQGKVIFNGGFTMKTSSRRIKNQGFFRTFVIYIYHFFKVILK